MRTTFVSIVALAAFVWTGGPAAQQPAPTPSQTPARLSEAQVVSALREKAAQEAAADRFAGAVAIAKQGKIFFSSCSASSSSARLAAATTTTCRSTYTNRRA